MNNPAAAPPRNGAAACPARHFSALWRRKLAVAAGVILTTALVWAGAALVPPLYTARATILIEPRGAAPLMLAAEREVLLSRGLAQAVADELRLMDDPAFNAHLPAPAGDGAYKGIAVHEPAQGDVPAGVMDRALGDVLDRFRAGLSVAGTPDSNVLHISYTDRDPVRAALIANRLAGLYADRRLAAQRAEEEQTLKWLADRLESLRATMLAAEDKLIAFTATGDDIEPPPAAAPGLDRAAILAEYKAHDDALRRQLAEMSQRYGEKHPEIRNLRAAIAESGKRLRSQAVAITPPAPSPPVTEAAARERERQNLAREAATARQMFDSFLATYQALQTPPAALTSGVHLISPAVIPPAPSWPPLRLWLWCAAGGSFALFALLALLSGHSRRTFRAAEDVESATGLPCYALLPLVAAAVPGDMPAADIVLSRAAAHAAESVRSLRAMTMLRAPAGAERPRVIAITSSHQGEGKSTLSAWLARTAAKSGEKVIVVDCDMRRPALHKAFGKIRSVTLSDYLDNEAKLEDTIDTDDPGGVHMIFAAAVPARALDLLSSDRLARLVAALRKTYDLVILDAPACMAVTDPLLLARQADLTLYSVVWNDTPRATVTAALRPFNADSRARMAVVLNKVDLAAYAAYGYGDLRYEYVPAPA